jgi:hypothetical protein
MRPMSLQFCRGRSGHPKYIWRGIQIRNLVIGQKTTPKYQCCIFESCWFQKWQTWMTRVTKYVRAEIKINNVSVQISSPVPLDLCHLWFSQVPYDILQNLFPYPHQIFFYPFSII